MASVEYTITPSAQPLGSASLSALLRLDQATNQWIVTVVITRAAGQPQIQGHEVDAQLLDSQGRPFAVLERPSGPLVEAGDSLGMSANALFRFEAPSVTPAELAVTYQGRAVSFRVMPAAPL